MVGVAISSALLYLALRRVDGDAAWRSIKATDPLLLLAGVLLMNVGVIAMSFRWRLLVGDLVASPPATSAFLKAIVCAQAVNNVLPARAGDLVRIAWLGRAAGLRPASAAGSMLTDRALDVLALTTIIAVGVPFVPQERWVVALGIAAAAASLLLVGLWGGCRVYARRAGHAAPEDEATGWVARNLRRFLHSVGAVTLGPRLLRMVGWTAMIWGTWAFGAWAIAEGMNLTVGPLELLFVAGLVNVGLAIPSSPGFVGTYQWLVVAGLGLFAVDASPAFAFSVVLQLAWLIPQTIVGLVLLPHLGMSLRGVRRVEVMPEAHDASAGTR